MSKLGNWLSGESKKNQSELDAKYIASILTSEDVAEFCEHELFTNHVLAIMAEYGPFEISPDGSVTMGMAPLPEYVDLDLDDTSCYDGSARDSGASEGSGSW